MMGETISLEEIKEVLRSFPKDKSRGPDGWTIEFYLVFFYLIRNYILSIVEKAKTSGRCLG